MGSRSPLSALFLLVLPATFVLASTRTVAARYDLTIAFAGITPHVGQTMHLRVVDLNDRREVARDSRTVPAAAFTWTLPRVLVAGHSYDIDFFADLNGNGRYDPPPTDHAWRIRVNDVTGTAKLTFAHNVNFTDIKWPYAVRLDFVGMTPHLGNKLWARLVDIGTGREVSRDSTTVRAPNLTVVLPGIMIGSSYHVDFYADHNRNGRYDPPPVDHAWRLTLADADGDTMLTFTHTTDFTDIKWPNPAAAR